MLRAEYREPAQCELQIRIGQNALLTESKKADIQIEAIRDNWLDLQREWDEIDDTERYDIHHYFNGLNGGLGDLLFQNSSASIHGKLSDMPLEEGRLILRKMQECRLVQFVGSNELSTGAGSFVPMEISEYSSSATIPGYQWEWLMEKLGVPKPVVILIEDNRQMHALEHFFEQWE